MLSPVTSTYVKGDWQQLARGGGKAARPTQWVEGKGSLCSSFPAVAIGKSQPPIYAPAATPRLAPNMPVSEW